MNKQFYPVNLNISKFNILIIGLGEVGFRKLQDLLPYKPQIKIISKEIRKDRLAFISEFKNIIYELRSYKKEDISSCDMIFACTDDEYTQNLIMQDVEKEKQNRFILSNYCKFQEKSNFTNMSKIQKDDFAIAISTYTKSPSITKQLRIKLKEIIEKLEI